MEQTSIIVRPIITEQSMDQATKNRFTFMVLRTADKKQIKKAIEAKFVVNVVSIQTMITKGKRGRAGKRRVEIPLSYVKKAVVGLKKGQKIELFDMQSQEKGKKEEKSEKA